MEAGVPYPVPYPVPYHYDEWLGWWAKQPLAKVVEEVAGIDWWAGYLVVRQKAAVTALARRLA